MSSLGGSTVSSSYNRLLVLPAGGGDGANLVSLTDGDNATTFGLKISTTDMSLPANGKLYFDGNLKIIEDKWMSLKKLFKKENLSRKECILLPFKTLKRIVKI